MPRFQFLAPPPKPIPNQKTELDRIKTKYDAPKVRLRTTRPTYDQVSKVAAKFGGPYRLAMLLQVEKSTVYRWMAARPRGGDGLFPTKRVIEIRSLARINGVVLTSEDWEPNLIDYTGAPETGPYVPNIYPDTVSGKIVNPRKAKMRTYKQQVFI